MSFEYEYITIEDVEEDIYCYTFSFSKEGYCFDVEEDIVFNEKYRDDKVIIKHCVTCAKKVEVELHLPYSFLIVNNAIDEESLTRGKLPNSVVSFLGELGCDLHSELWEKLRLNCSVLKTNRL